MHDRNQQISTSKKVLRASLRQRFSSSWPDPVESGAAIVGHLLGMSIFRQISGHGLAGFMPFGSEPAIDGFLSGWLLAGGVLYLPIFDVASRVYALSAVTDLSSQLIIGHHNIREPLSELPRFHPPFGHQQIQAWLVPGLAFAHDGRRLGHGAGYYDRLLDGAGGCKIGIAHDCQIVDTLPSADHDVRMNILVTESQVIECE